MNRFDETLACVDRLQRAQTPEEVCCALIRITSRFGLTAMIAGTIPGPGLPLPDLRSHVLLYGWPEDWTDRYEAMNHFEHDPIVAYMRRTPSAVFWRDAIGRHGASREARRVLSDAAAFNLKDGFALPLATLEGEQVVVSFGGEEVDLSPEEAGVVSLVSTIAVGRAIQLSASRPAVVPRPSLTDREKECMRWAAHGKSEWEISRILGISEHTSEKHLLSAKAKLGAANRVQAVAEAIRHGYIS